MPGEMPFCKDKLKENMLGTSKRLRLIKEMPRPKCGPGGVEPHRHPIATWYMTLT